MTDAELLQIIKKAARKGATELDLRDNQLSQLPPEIAQLTNLQYLNLRGNNLPIPPEILEKSDTPAEILNYYLQLIVERKPLNEAKMLLVGQGSVGKTSLVKQLTDGKFDLHENKTEGINIQPWQIRVNNRKDIPRTNICFSSI